MVFMRFEPHSRHFRGSSLELMGFFCLFYFCVISCSLDTGAIHRNGYRNFVMTDLEASRIRGLSVFPSGFHATHGGIKVA